MVTEVRWVRRVVVCSWVGVTSGAGGVEPEVVVSSSDVVSPGPCVGVTVVAGEETVTVVVGTAVVETVEGGSDSDIVGSGDAVVSGVVVSSDGFEGTVVTLGGFVDAVVSSGG